MSRPPHLRPSPRFIDPFRNMLVFYGEGLLAPRPTPKLEDHPLSFVRGCLFNILAANLQLDAVPSIRNARTRHALVKHIHPADIKFRKVQVRRSKAIPVTGIGGVSCEVRTSSTYKSKSISVMGRGGPYA
jgi:hypothetical protein